jgi:uncharacterized protein YjbI with pentapeptide repeats
MSSRNGLSCRVTARQAQLAVLVALPLLAIGPQVWAADLTTREVVGALFKAAPGSAPDLSGKDLSRLDLAGVDFKRANLARASLFGTDLAGANLSKADLAGAVLDRATITRANFADANLSRASILRPNVFSSLEAVSTEVPDFSRTNLAGAQLSGHFDLTSFRGADLTNARFGPRDPRSEVLITGRAQLAGCDFSDAKLHNANLSRSSAKYAKFARAELRAANLSQANLKGADFTGADLTDANFTGAVLDGATFTDARGLDRARGLQQGFSGDSSAAPSNN